MDRSEVVRKAVMLAEKTGYVTFNQLNALIPSAEASPEEIEAVLTALSERDIRMEAE